MTNEYPYPVIDRVANGRNISIMGALHTREFFEWHSEYFGREIENADALVIEQSFIDPNQGSENESLLIDEIEELDFTDDEFFGRIAKIAHENQIPIFIIDPFTEEIYNADHYIFAYAAMLTAFSGVDLIKRLAKEDITRRRFFADMLLGAAGLSLAGGSFPGVHYREEINEEALQEHGIDDLFFYGATDFRNIKIAEGLDRISNQVTGINNILSIHGAHHYKQIDAYLLNPELRVRILAYPIYNELGNINIREYRPVRITDWVQVNEV